jgi:hypothetical protein
MNADSCNEDILVAYELSCLLELSVESPGQLKPLGLENILNIRVLGIIITTI